MLLIFFLCVSSRFGVGGGGGETRHPFHPLDPPLFVHLLICDGFVGLQRVCSDRAAVPKKKKSLKSDSNERRRFLE